MVAQDFIIPRALIRFLGMDGKSQVVDTNFFTTWNEMFVDNDTINSNTGHVDPRYMFRTSIFDVLRWPSRRMELRELRWLPS